MRGPWAAVAKQARFTCGLEAVLQTKLTQTAPSDHEFSAIVIAGSVAAHLFCLAKRD